MEEDARADGFNGYRAREKPFILVYRPLYINISMTHLVHLSEHSRHFFKTLLTWPHVILQFTIKYIYWYWCYKIEITALPQPHVLYHHNEFNFTCFTSHCSLISLHHQRYVPIPPFCSITLWPSPPFLYPLHTLPFGAQHSMNDNALLQQLLQPHCILWACFASLCHL